MSHSAENRRFGVKMILEGFVVVVSILIAFALDAWWEGRIERRELLQDLVNVEQELTSNVALVRQAVDFQSRAVASVDELLVRLEEVPAGRTFAVQDTILLFAFVSTPSYDPSTGAVDALIASGRLSELDDPELKRILTEFRTTVADIREDELGARNAAHDRVLPLFWDTSALASAFGKVNDMYVSEFGAAPMNSSLVQLPNPPEFANRLQFRRAWVIAALRELELHRDRLERGAALVRDQVGTSN